MKNGCPSLSEIFKKIVLLYKRDIRPLNDNIILSENKDKAKPKKL